MRVRVRERVRVTVERELHGDDVDAGRALGAVGAVGTRRAEGRHVAHAVARPRARVRGLLLLLLLLLLRSPARLALGGARPRRGTRVADERARVLRQHARVGVAALGVDHVKGDAGVLHEGVAVVRGARRREVERVEEAGQPGRGAAGRGAVHEQLRRRVRGRSAREQRGVLLQQRREAVAELAHLALGIAGELHRVDRLPPVRPRAHPQPGDERPLPGREEALEDGAAPHRRGAGAAARRRPVLAPRHGRRVERQCVALADHVDELDAAHRARVRGDVEPPAPRAHRRRKAHLPSVAIQWQISGSSVGTQRRPGGISVAIAAWQGRTCSQSGTSVPTAGIHARGSRRSSPQPEASGGPTACAAAPEASLYCVREEAAAAHCSRYASSCSAVRKPTPRMVTRVPPEMGPPDGRTEETCSTREAAERHRRDAARTVQRLE